MPKQRRKHPPSAADQQISFRLPSSLLSALRHHAIETDRSTAHLIRLAIKNLLSISDVEPTCM